MACLIKSGLAGMIDRRLEGEMMTYGRRSRRVSSAETMHRERGAPSVSSLTSCQPIVCTHSVLLAACITLCI
eukprot:scaffold18405_cov26-Tisochrysis_lutea.AAC.1